MTGVIQSNPSRMRRAWLAFKRFWNYQCLGRSPKKGGYRETYEGAAPGCVRVIRDDGLEYDYPEG